MEEYDGTGSKEVVLLDETYSIVELPPSHSKVVVKQKELLLGAVDLQALVSDLGRVGNFVRIAYNGVAGYTDLQIQIREIGYNVTKLCDKSAVTVAKFKQASSSILGDLQGTYEFLLDGLEEMAIETLSAVTDIAKDMATAADQLHTDFDNESKNVEVALKKTMQTKGSEEERKKEIEKKEKEIEVDKKRAEENKKAAEEDFSLYEEKFKKAEAKQEAKEASASNPLKRIANAFLAPVGLKAFDLDQEYDQARDAKEEKLKHLEEMKKQRDARRSALEDIAEFTKKIENCKDDSELAGVAIEALHSAMGGLQKLSAVMMKAALFWKQMQTHCEQLAKEKMQKMIERAIKMSETKRLKVWTSNAFKKQAIEYYAQWVALDDVCGIYRLKIMETQKDLYGYLQENPTLKEARRNVRDLATKFKLELEAEQKAIADKDAQDNEEVKKLGRSK